MFGLATPGQPGLALLLGLRSAVGVGHRVDQRLFHLVAVPFGSCRKQDRVCAQDELRGGDPDNSGKPQPQVGECLSQGTAGESWYPKA